MSSPEPNSPVASSAAPPDNEALVRLLREELVKTQLIVLDLNDRVLEKETEKADAVSILGKLELVLEQKVNLIGDLQATHAGQLSALREQLLTSEASGAAKDAAIREFSSRLATAQLEIAQFRSASETQARDLSLNQQALADAHARIEQLTTQLARSEESLTRARGQLAKILRSGWWKMGRPWRAVFGPKL